MYVWTMIEWTIKMWCWFLMVTAKYLSCYPHVCCPRISCPSIFYKYVVLSHFPCISCLSTCLIITVVVHISIHRSIVHEIYVHPSSLHIETHWALWCFPCWSPSTKLSSTIIQSKQLPFIYLPSTKCHPQDHKTSPSQPCPLFKAYIQVDKKLMGEELRLFIREGYVTQFLDWESGNREDGTRVWLWNQKIKFYVGGCLWNESGERTDSGRKHKTLSIIRNRERETGIQEKFL